MFASVSQRGREGGSLELCRALHGATGCERPPSTHHPHTSAASCAQYADPAVRMVGAQGFEMMLFDLGKMDATSSPATHSAVLRREAAVAGACGSRVERAARRAELLAAENVLSHLHAASPPALKSHHHPLNPPPPLASYARTDTDYDGWLDWREFCAYYATQPLCPARQQLRADMGVEVERQLRSAYTAFASFGQAARGPGRPRWVLAGMERGQGHVAKTPLAAGTTLSALSPPHQHHAPHCTLRTQGGGDGQHALLQAGEGVWAGEPQVAHARCGRGVCLGQDTQGGAQVSARGAARPGRVWCNNLLTHPPTYPPNDCPA